MSRTEIQSAQGISREPGCNTRAMQSSGRFDCSSRCHGEHTRIPKKITKKRINTSIRSCNRKTVTSLAVYSTIRYINSRFESPASSSSQACNCWLFADITIFTRKLVRVYLHKLSEQETGYYIEDRMQRLCNRTLRMRYVRGGLGCSYVVFIRPEHRMFSGRNSCLSNGECKAGYPAPRTFSTLFLS